MAIKDNDGNVFRLRGPNPLLKNQAQWEAARAKLINMNIGRVTEVGADERNPITKFKTDYDILDIGDELNLISNEEFAQNVAKLPTNKPKEQELKPLVVRKVELDPPQEDIVVETSVAPEPKPMEASLGSLKSKMIQFYHAPAIQTMRVDEFYGTSYKVTTYGQKSEFDGIIVAQTDLELQFWTVNRVFIGSVVFPKNADRRWWRVEDVEPKTGGFLCKAFVSDVTPDFS